MLELWGEQRRLNVLNVHCGVSGLTRDSSLYVYRTIVLVALKVKRE